MPSGTECLLTCVEGYEESGDGNMACFASVLAEQTCDPKPCSGLRQMLKPNGNHDCGCVTAAHHADPEDTNGCFNRDIEIVDGARRLQTISAGPMQR
jgi:hypothetical protein